MKIAQIKTNKALYPYKGELCYIKRTMRNFNEDDFMTGFKSIVIDETFIIITEDYTDENGDTQTREVEKLIGTIRTEAHPVKIDEVRALFTAIGKDILKEEDWIDKYQELKENALLIDTSTVKYQNGLCVFNTHPEDWVKVNY